MVSLSRMFAPKDRAVFELRPYRPLPRADTAALADAASRYGEFLGRTGVLEITG